MLRFATVRILLDYRPALRERTGVGEFVHELARALARSGADDVAVFSTSWKHRPTSEAATDLGRVAIVDRRIPVRGLTWAWNRLGWPPVEWLAGEADVVHAQSPLLIPARRAARVVTIHDLDFLAHPERTEAEMRRDFPALARDHAQRADHVVVSSAYAAREVCSRLDLPRDRISICAPGAPSWAAAIARARAAGTTTPSTLGTSGTLGPILFIGTLERRKNISGLLDAYGRLRHRRPDTPPLVLAGRARASIGRDLQRVEFAPLAGHVRLMGYVSDLQRQALYREACMLVLPSLEEGFGLPVLEAMACGVPVVVSARGALPEVAGEATQPVDPTDPDAIAAAMEHLLDPASAKAATQRGLRQAARYDWDRCAAAARDAYREAVTRRQTRVAVETRGGARVS